MIRSRPEVLLTGLRLPGLDGFELAGHPEVRSAGTRVLVLSAFDQPGLVRRAMEAGVCGFVTKAQPLANVVAAVRQVHAGDSAFANHLLTQAMSSGVNPLNQRETEILRQAMEGQCVQETACHLNLAPGTVQNHMTRAKRKLGARTVADAIRIVRQHGWF